MTVGSFDPSRGPVALDAEVIGELLAAAARLDEPRFGLTPERIEQLAACARQGDVDWAPVAAAQSAIALERLIRLFTLAERLPGWEAGAKSPVIVLAAELKRRDAYPPALTRWIRANSSNRFLPHGSLLDRL